MAAGVEGGVDRPGSQFSQQWNSEIRLCERLSAGEYEHHFIIDLCYLIDEP